MQEICMLNEEIAVFLVSLYFMTMHTPRNRWKVPLNQVLWSKQASELPFLLGNNDKPTDRPTNQRRNGYEEWGLIRKLRFKYLIHVRRTWKGRFLRDMRNKYKVWLKMFQKTSFIDNGRGYRRAGNLAARDL